MKIKSTNPATASFHDSDLMPDDYEVVFDEDGGTVATVRKEVGEPLVESDDWPTIEAVDSDDQADEPPPEDSADDSDGEQANDGAADTADADDSTEDT